MGTILKGAAAVLAVAVGLYFRARTPDERVTSEGVAPAMANADAPDSAGLPPVSAGDDAIRSTARRAPLGQPLLDQGPPSAPADMLRVTLVGVTPEEARAATVTLRGADKRDGWPRNVGGTWPCQGLTSEFDLDPAFARLAGHQELRPGRLEVAVEHPHLIGKTAWVSTEEGVEASTGAAVHEVRVELRAPEFWPEFALSVRDARTRAHLDGVEVRIRSGPGMAAWGRNPPSRLLGDELQSPIVLMGGRDLDADAPKVAGMALSPPQGTGPRLVELVRQLPPERGVIVSARAPGYAWGTLSIDVSQGERELLLTPSAGMNIQLANAAPERYAELETDAMLCVYWIREDDGNQYVHFERLHEGLEAGGLRLENLEPGGYRLAFELGGGSWTQQPVLARDEILLTAGEMREVVLTLDDPPEPPERASLGGVISFPEFSASEQVLLQLYFQPTQRWMKPDFELRLAELERLGGTLPAWSFRVEDLPVGMYRVQLMPLLKAWMIELAPEGVEDLELVVPELAEVRVETVNGRTGERDPRGELYFRYRDPAAGQQQRDLASAEMEEPGLFRFWSAPGGVRIWPKFPNGAEREFGGNGMDLDLVSGRQFVKFELAPPYALRFEFREDGTTLPTGPRGMRTTEDLRAIDHEGRVVDGGLQRDMIVEVSAPGLYEIDFDRATGDEYHPLQPPRVEVRAGEMQDVVVELRRK